ncbi:sulfonate ABC transporter substrate-binding protein [Sphaerisporangium melleum]|uniref:Sulfonate ABC transporter substrate-binding protein n=1 Tax=Sphaerisporangium melleum TaxID=321316 RepID=A0A917VIB1_9ACTN|nr:ABC transporter substrate-binding protein [Sphaerisporangium melleum]GGK81934.1 sulfonate ABC transporter substrate-binding protein [Sphaerisporangium melleum]GII73783.1 sulfonate ABC transporter substrate-binding protein [Sphaerisporangium melleum]
MKLHRATALSLLVVAVVAAASCGRGTPTPAAPGVEKATIVVGAMPNPDSAPLHMAVQRGYFAQQGLTVKIREIQSGTAALVPLQGGGLDFTLGNYVSTYAAQSQGAGPFLLVEDAYEAAPGTFLLMVPPKSPIKGLTDLRGKRIAVASVRSIVTLAVDNALETAGMSEQDVQFVSMPFPDMLSQLMNERVDAAVLIEPFISQFQKDFGGREVWDLMSGSMGNFPIAAWTTTVRFAKQYPNTTAAFQRAMARAQNDASWSHKAVVDILPTFTKIPSTVAEHITMGNFPVNLSVTRAQRVADVMAEHGYLDKPLDVKAILAAQPTAGGAS